MTQETLYYRNSDVLALMMHHAYFHGTPAWNHSFSILHVIYVLHFTDNFYLSYEFMGFRGAEYFQRREI